MKTIGGLASKIDSSLFFKLDPEKDYSLREREKNRLIELLYEYEMLLDRASLEEMGLEFMEVFSACVRSYVPGSFPFTHYFNAAFKRRKSKKFASEKIDDDSGGIKMSDGVKRRVHAVAKFLDSHPDISMDKLIGLMQEFSGEFDMSSDEFKEAVYLYHNTHAQRLDAPVAGEDGSELRDLIPGQDDFSEAVMNKDYMFRVMDVMNECYLEKRNDAKPVISALVTSMLSDLFGADRDYREYAENKEFFDPDVSRMAERLDRPLKLNEIQQYLGKTNITVTVRNYLAQVRERLEMNG